MFSYDFLRHLEIWLAAYACLMQLVCLLVTWDRVTIGDAWRYLSACLFLGAFTFGTFQVLHSNVPGGTRIYYLTVALMGINSGLTYTFISNIKRRRKNAVPK